MSNGPLLRQVRLDTYGSFITGTIALFAAVFAGACMAYLGSLNDYYPMAVVLFLFLGGVLFLGNAVRLKLWPASHWLLRGLAEHGPIMEVARKIDAEWGDPNARVIGNVPAWPTWKIDANFSFVVLTANWLVRLKTGLFQTVPLARVVWIYKQVRANAAPIAVRPYFYGIGLRCDDGRTIVVELDRESDVDLVLELLLKPRPELPAGYRGEWVGTGNNTGQLRRQRNQMRAAAAQWSDEQRQERLMQQLEDLQSFPRRVDPLNPETER